MLVAYAGFRAWRIYREQACFGPLAAAIARLARFPRAKHAVNTPTTPPMAPPTRRQPVRLPCCPRGSLLNALDQPLRIHRRRCVEEHQTATQSASAISTGVRHPVSG